MQILKIVLALFVSLALFSASATAQNKAVVVPLEGDSLTTIVLPEEEPIPTEPVYLEDLFDKPLVFNKGWDTVLNNKPKIDPSVVLTFRGLTPFGPRPASRGAITFDPVKISQWGEQTFFPSSKKIYAKSVLMIDKGDRLEGGVFEWLLDNQNFVSLGNIVINNFTGKYNQAWIRNWTDPQPGDTVWFFIISDDERFSSNAFSFVWQ